MPNLWNLPALHRVPAFHEIPDFPTPEPSVRPIFYEGLPWRGQPTQVFAWLGFPAHSARTTVPAMVLIHGGGGTAFADWVALWNRRGYAALALDTCGCTAGGEHENRPRHPRGGPPGWGGYDQLDQPPADQWMYHAVANVLLAHTLLASLPGVDPARIGATGISWGGIICGIVAGLDDRFKIIAPVYGCGFLDQDSDLCGSFRKIGPAQTARWLQLWDPSHYLPVARMPMLWINGTNDFAFPLDIFQRSYRLPSGPRRVSIRLEMPHDQFQGQSPVEIAAFADRHLRSGPDLIQILDQGVTNHHAWACFAAPQPITDAHLLYTRDAGAARQCKWLQAPATIAADRVTAPLPPGTRAWMLNLTDPRSCLISTEHAQLPPSSGN